MFDVENYFITEIMKNLNYMIGECKFSYRDVLWFNKEVEKDTFVLGISVHSEEYKYVALTNILLPNSMKRNGVSIEIITILANLCKETKHDLYITQITNENWEQGLLRHGCFYDDDGDIVVDVNRWISTHIIRKLRFEEIEGHMILDSCIDNFKSMKQKCIDEAMRIFKSWDATINVIEDSGYIEEITAIKDDERYLVKFSYSGIIRMFKLIAENEFENYLKEKRYIGTIWG